jgi:hypothetical protein
MRSEISIHKSFCIGFASLFIACLLGCGSSKQASSVTTVGSWIKKDSLPTSPNNSVFITVLAQNMNARYALENELASAATAHGIKAVKSVGVLTPVTGVPDSVLINVFVRKVNESGCSRVLIVSLVDSKNDTKYIPGSSYTYNPYMYGGYYGYYPTYYASTFSTISSPGYYVSNNTYYIESNLYDVATEVILFSIQTKAVNPDDIDKSSKWFAENLVDELKENGLLKKK